MRGISAPSGGCSCCGWVECHRAGGFAYTHTDYEGRTPCQEEEYLVDAEQIGTEFLRRGSARETMEVFVFHLRFQRTLPSRESSNSIPRSASSLRTRSAVVKSRRLRAA